MENRYRLQIGALLILLLMAGCIPPASEVKPTPVSYSAIELQYPESSFITAWGVSNSSYREAVLNAKTQVSEQISSRLESETISYAEAVMRDSEVTDYQRLTSEVKSRTAFTRAELIRIDPASRLHKRGIYNAFAYISRHELMEILTADYADAAQLFQHHIDQYTSLHSDIAGYTLSWRRAYQAYAEMASTACAIRAVVRHPFPPFQEARVSMRKLNRDRISLLERTQVYVNLHRSKEIDRNALSESLRGALVELGVAASVGHCRGTGVQLELTPTIIWRRIMVDICEVTLEGELLECSSGSRLTDVSLSGPALCGQGRDPIGNLYRQASPAALAPILRESLVHVLPLDD